MASGSSAGRANKSGSKGSFDFASDDILCSYEDYDDRKDRSDGNHSDPVIGTNSSKDLEKNRISRSSVFPNTNIYTQPEVSLNQEVIATVENTMKRYTDNCMRFLEGISSRLSQLELYCYNLDKSIGEMRTELAHDNKEADGKLKSLDKHLQEVHRSVQILRDKQELAETQKELAKLQLAQKEEKSATPASEPKRSEDGPEMHSQQLALAIPHQIVQIPPLPTRATEQQQPPVASSQMASQNITQQPPYYLPATQVPNPAAQPQPPQGPYAPPADPQYRAPQMTPNPQQGQVSQPPQLQQYPQYQQQWPQPPVQPTQTQLMQSQTQNRAPPTVYPTYSQNQPPQEQLASSMPMQVPTPQVSRADAVPYGYGGPGWPHQTQPPPQPMKGGDGYAASGGSYMMYDGSHHPPQAQFSSRYQPANTSHHNPQPPPTSGGHMIRDSRPPQFVGTHPYNEVIEKLVSMGYRGDHVASVIQRLKETGQPVDFNTVLDRLNGHSSNGSERPW
ncbi:hypothetical protein V2J09_019197 [Rumex salicifolius]